MVYAGQVLGQPGTYWQANWIGAERLPSRNYQVLHFAKSFELESLPQEYVVQVSADQRYKLYLNGKWIGEGPARGDLLHWRFESIDLAPHLKPGKNVLAALVFDMGQYSPVAQISLEAAFILQDTGRLSLNSNRSWKVLRNKAFHPQLNDPNRKKTYLVIGPTDSVALSEYPQRWEMLDPDLDWQDAVEHSKGQGWGVGTDGGRFLMPRDIPMMRSDKSFWGYSLSDGVVLDESFSLSLKPGESRKLLIDRRELIIGYPSLKIKAAGRGAKIRIRYSEALVDSLGNKGYRDDWQGKTSDGISDILTIEGPGSYTYEPLWYRTWRYIELHLEAGDAELELSDFEVRLTGYPFKQVASWKSSDPRLEKIWETGWRTALNCAHETYMDCPYYEQLQYVGDTRIQALISLVQSGDDRLMQRGVRDFDQSRLSFGLTQSRYPSSRTQVITPLSLFWVAMVYDHWMYRGDEALLREMMPGIGEVLDWHDAQVGSSGMLEDLPWWNFVDWTPEWPWSNTLRVGGEPAHAPGKGSVLLSLQYAMTLRLAAEMLVEVDPARSALYAGRLRQLLGALPAPDPKTGYLPDLAGGNAYSQHCQIMWILSGAFDERPKEGR